MPESLHPPPPRRQRSAARTTAISVGQDANERDDPGLARKLRLTSPVAPPGAGRARQSRPPGPGGGVPVVAAGGYRVCPLRMTGPARSPFLLGGPSVISMVRKSRGSAALVIGKVQLPPSGTWNVPAAATWPFRLTYQQVYHWRSPKLLR